jgi:type I restriction enzyme R subunit
MNTPTDITEKGLEDLIVRSLVEETGYEEGRNGDYDRGRAVDTEKLFRFLGETQGEELEKIGAAEPGRAREKFLDRLQAEVAKRGVVDVLRKGVKAYPGSFFLFAPTPSAKNAAARELFGKNVFSVTRQLRYSGDAGRLALDLCLFVNGLPVLTCELKNRFTGQDVRDAVEQYRRDRDPAEPLFAFKRCMAHFAVDDARAMFCTRLAKKDSWFLPFDRGRGGGAGNPPNPSGTATDYLWKDIFRKESLADIIENYAQVVEEPDPATGRMRQKQIFPRYHQLDVVRRLLADVKGRGVGGRYLVQHSAGSGKSNSIAWLAHQLVGLERADGEAAIDQVVVVTDRVNLDRQIRDTIRQFAQEDRIVAHAEDSGSLAEWLRAGKKIVVTTIEKFPFIQDEIGTSLRDRRFAVVIDEAHSSQSGRLSAKMNMAVSGQAGAEGEEDPEDRVNRAMEGRKMAANASYFAFTATPKNKTLEMFGTRVDGGAGGREGQEGRGGQARFRPFHVYSMKQAIEEGFILDVLRNYTPWKSYYQLVKTVADDPAFDAKKAQKKIRAFVEGNELTIARKAAVVVEHFHRAVAHRIGGEARAMVVTAGIERALEWHAAIGAQLKARRSPFKAVVAFSGEKEFRGRVETEATVNGFPSSRIEAEFRGGAYRFLVVADKFQTGYDEPLLSAMYVDKILTDIKAVQTLSRLNRARPGKHEVFVLDFANEPEAIREAFSRYYKTTLLAGETDPNKLHDLVRDMDAHQVFPPELAADVADRCLAGAPRPELDALLDPVAAAYGRLDEDGQVAFKGAAKAFVRTYGFLAAILPVGQPEWERLSIFLTLLLPKLPSPREDDLSQGILDAIDLDSYRLEAQAQMAIAIEDKDAEVAPVPVGAAAGRPEAQLDPLTAIIDAFNQRFGNIDWTDADNVREQIRRLPEMVRRDERFRNAQANADAANARLESDRALADAVAATMKDGLELFKQFADNEDFRRFLQESIFRANFNLPRPAEKTWRYSHDSGVYGLADVAESR